MIPKSNKWMTRRHFLTIFGKTASALAMGVTFPFLQIFTTKDVEALGERPGELAQLINGYRKQNRLPEIPLSPELMAVAQKHIMDLATYHPENNCNGNFHSWSQHGNWKGGCFDLNNPSTYPIMWDKPKEIANYPSKGYEIAYAGSSNAQEALTWWKNSQAHNNVILNKGMWTNYKWMAIGASYGGGYACAWFA